MANSEEQKTLLKSPQNAISTTPLPSGKDIPPQKKAQSRRPRFFLTWYQELLACVAFIAALIAMIVTLRAYRNKPTPDWPDWLSLNSILAVYMVLLKSCVLLVTAEGLGQLKWCWFASDPRPLYDIVRFDDATRGPWGAAKLLCRLRGKQLLASLGAVLTLLTLVGDPAVQQIVHFDECQMVLPGVHASLPRTAKWSAGGQRVAPLVEAMVPEVRQAIDAAVSGGLAPLPATCSSGNCTWTAEYASLGWAGFCNDISDEVVFINYTSRSASTNTTVVKAKSSIPGGIEVTQPIGGMPLGEWASMGPAPLNASKPANSIAVDFLLGRDAYQTSPGSSPLTGQRWEECNGDAVDSQNWKCRGYGAARCWIFPSTKNYNATMKGSQLYETVLDADNAWGSNDGMLMSSLDTHCLSSSERADLVALGYTLDPQYRWLGYNSTSENVAMEQPVNGTFPDSLMKHGCQYIYWKPSIDAIQSYLTGHFTGNVSGLSVVAGQVDTSALDGPQAIQSLYNFGNVTFDRINTTIWNLAQALENRVRVSGHPEYSAAALGEVMLEKTCIRIRWGWLAYPAALVALTLVFFGLMMVETRPKGVIADVWKSSSLALLYHGLMTNEGDELNAATTDRLELDEEMRNEAKRTMVRLSSTGKGRSGLEIT